MLNLLAGESEKNKEKKLQDDLREMEVKAVMNDMLNKVSQDYMDVKFEQSLAEVVEQLEKYVAKVNETSEA